MNIKGNDTRVYPFKYLVCTLNILFQFQLKKSRIFCFVGVCVMRRNKFLNIQQIKKKGILKDKQMRG